MNDASREHQIHGKSEVVAVLEKERALFRKEDFETLVHSDLRLVRFDLAEVGVDGGIEHKTAVEDELGIDAGLSLEIAVLEERIVGVTLINIAKSTKQSIRNELDIAAGRDLLDTSRRCGLVEASLDPIRNARPENVLVSARDTAVQNDAPLLLIGV